MLLNVRLGPEEERVVKGLRRAKVNVSSLVRKAIRDAAPGVGSAPAPLTLLDEILAQVAEHPAPATKRPRLDDRRALAAHIRRRVARKLGR